MKACSVMHPTGHRGPQEHHMNVVKADHLTEYNTNDFYHKRVAILKDYLCILPVHVKC